MSLNTLDAIAKRFSCRSFNEKNVSDEQLEEIIKAGLAAPSGMNRQNWQIIVVKNQDLIKEMEQEGMKNMSYLPDKSMYNRIMSRGGNLFYNAKSMILLTVKEANPRGAELIDLGILAQNIVLAATGMGLASLHCGLVGFAFAGDKADYFKDKLKFAPSYQCGLAVLLGYCDNEGSPHPLDYSKVTMIEKN